MDIFTNRFNEILHYDGIKQSELASSIGISRQCITDFKSGRSLPSIQTLTLICKKLEISSDYLLGITENPAISNTASTATAINPELEEKEKAMLSAFRQLLPETQDFVLRTAQSLKDKRDKLGAK